MSVTAQLDACRRPLDASGALLDAACRAKLAEGFNGIARFTPAELGSALVGVAVAAVTFRKALARDLTPLLENTLCWTEEEGERALWAAHASWRWSSIASTAAEGAPGDPGSVPVIGAALALSADSIKWHAICSLARPAGLLARAAKAYRLAQDNGFGDTDMPIEVDGAVLSRHAQHLYLRVLLLDYLASGNLSRQQIEVADAWLTRWTRDYQLALAPPPGAARLWIDGARAEGLRLGEGAPGEMVRYVVLEALPRQIASVERGFHSGRIFPGSGVSVKFRLEEHIAVIDQFVRLQATLAARGAARRGERTRIEGATVEVFHGVHEIVERGFRAAPAARMPLAVHASFEAQEAHTRRRDPVDAIAPLEIARRWMSLRDASDGGVGLLAGRGEHDEICVGDLIAVREDDSGPLAIGEVARRAPAGQAGGTLVGVQIRSRAARPVKLKRLATDGHRSAAMLDALFLPGADACGRGDSIAVGDVAFSARARYEIRFDDEVFVLALNRVRRQGRGWMACGFEVLERTKAAEPVKAPAPVVAVR